MSLEKVVSGETPRFLLLLPPLSGSPTIATLKTAYGSTISEVLKEVATHSADAPKAPVLEIAFACAHLVDTRNKPRSSLYDQTQTLVAGLYKLIVVTAAQEDVNVEDADGVDVRVILVAWSPDAQSQAQSDADCYGPVITIQTLARCGRVWQYAFGVESEDGASMVKDFVQAKGQGEEVGDSQSGPGPTASAGNKTVPANQTHSKHYDVAVGGTWDHLHIGHKLLITMTIFTVDERPDNGTRTAIVGITGDQLLVKKKHANLVESWADRQKAVATFFNAIIDFSQPSTPGQRHVSIQDDPSPNGRSIDIHYPNNLIVKCVEIQDPFGPTITEEQISALVLSAETRAGGKAINDKRAELNWNALDVFEVDVLDATEDEAGSEVKEGFDSKISSTAIREKLARQAEEKA